MVTGGSTIGPHNIAVFNYVAIHTECYHIVSYRKFLISWTMGMFVVDTFLTNQM